MSDKGNRKNEMNAPPHPQVNLLPPEIRAARALQPVKRWVAITLVVTLVVVAGAFLLGTLERSNARSALETANEETEVLLAEQRQYAEVPIVVGALDKTIRAQQVTMATEVIWSDYLGAIEAVLPEDVSIDTLAVNVVAPSTQAALETPALARITFTTRSLAPPDVAEWMRQIESVPGLADARVVSVDVQGDQSAVARDEEDAEDDEAADDESRYYVASTTVLITTDALANRFSEVDEGADDAE